MFGDSEYHVLIVEDERQHDAICREKDKADRIYRAILDQTFEFIGLMTPDGTLIEANRTALKFVGIEESEVLGKPFWETPWWTHSKKVQNRLRDAVKAAASGEFVRFETTTHPGLSGGSLHYLDFSLKPVKNDRGDVIFLIPEGRDITNQKRMEKRLRASELRYRTLYESSHDAILILTPGNGFVAGNPAAIAMFACKDEREFISHSPGDLSPEYQPDGMLSRVKAQEMIAIALQNGSHFFEWTHKRIDRAEFPATVLLTRMNLRGEVQLQATVRDISREKRLEQQMIQRTAELEAANKELEAFAYSVSHDLRAPLRAINGFSQALLEDYANQMDSSAQDYLHRVQSATVKMAQLIDGLLQLSRVNRADMKHEPVNLSELAQTIVEQLQLSQPDRAVEFTVAADRVVRGDRCLLHCVLENLLGNAWKFTAPQSDAKIEFGSQPASGETVYFVRDNGVGFDMAYANKLFGVFQRLHSAAEFPGSGVGLASVQRIIRRHGGRVWAEGAVGKGATFYFTL
jgi:PAS domain S-box-containing protein